MKLLGYLLETAQKAHQKPYLTTVSCKLESNCPLLAMGKCIHVRVLSLGCVYGHESAKSGPTKRSKAYKDFIKESQDIVDAGPKLPQMTFHQCLAVIGEYVYLNYPRMDRCPGVPFLRPGNIVINGHPFVPKNDFTPEAVNKIASFRPPLYSGEDRNYQERVVPIFLFHLKYLMPELFQAACETNPQLADMVFDISTIKELKATLSAIPFGDTDGYTIEGLQVLRWDNEIELTGSPQNMGFFLPKHHGKNYRLIFEPDYDKTKVTITDPKLIKIALTQNPSLLEVS